MTRIETRLTIRLNETKRKALKEKAQKEGKTVTEVLEDFIDQYISISKPEDKISLLEKRITKVEEILEEKLGKLVA